MMLNLEAEFTKWMAAARVLLKSKAGELHIFDDAYI